MNPMRVQWKLRKLGDGSYEGTVVLPGALSQIVRAMPSPAGMPARRVRMVKARMLKRPGVAKRRVKVTRRASTPAGALSKAAAMADRLASNPLIQAAMPPGTTAAIKGLGIAAKLAQSGQLQKAGKFLKGKGAKRLFGAIKSLW